jgi:hypothetical protein
MPNAHVTEFIALAMRRGGWVRSMRRAEALLAWPRVVGRTVARFARAVAYEQGTLIVEVDDAETALHLGLQRSHILGAYARLGSEAPVRELRFRVGRSRPLESPNDGVAEAAASDPPPDPAEVERLVQTVAALPEAVASPAMRAGRALALWRSRKRALGWVPCVNCMVLTEPGSAAGRCPICARHASAAKVRIAAERLMVAPAVAPPELTDEEAAVARAIAAERAHAAVMEMVPHALAHPETLPALALAIRCAVALRRGVALAGVPDLRDVDAERDGIDARALRVLGPTLEEP